MDHKDKKQDQILYIGFNSKKSLISVGTEKGYHVYLSTTMEEVGHREMGGGLGIVEILNTSNLMVLTGGGRYPLFPLCKIIIFDDDEEKRKAEITFKSVVKAVKIKVDYQIVILESKILIYNTINDLELVYQAQTLMNIKGVFSVNYSDQNTLVAFPSEIKEKYEKQPELGWVSIIDMNKINNCDNLEDALQTIKPHKSAICCLEFNFSGSLQATASEKGTVIRVYETKKGSVIQELRRGHDPVILFNLSFDFEDNWVACISDSGTVHIFNIDKKRQQNSSEIKKNDVSESKNPKSVQKIFGFVADYFKNEFSFSSYKADFESKTKIGFQQDGSLQLLTYLGEVKMLGFDKVIGGNCKQIKHFNFLNSSEDN